MRRQIRIKDTIVDDFERSRRHILAVGYGLFVTVMVTAIAYWRSLT
jgi:hypothetical protein